MTKIALIDGDMFLFKAAAAVEQTCNWADEGQPELWTRYAKMTDAIPVVRRMVDAVVAATESDEVWMCLSDREGNFRKDLNPDYKSNRKDTYKPMLISPLEEWCKENYEYKLFANLEADDVMGILQTSMEDTVIISGDKDMLTIAGENYNHLTKEHKVITEDEADLWFHMQWLMGDRTDGYGGCDKIGPKKAETLLSECTPEERPQAVAVAYMKAGHDVRYRELMKNMARILQKQHWNFKTEQVVLL